MLSQPASLLPCLAATAAGGKECTRSWQRPTGIVLATTTRLSGCAIAAPSLACSTNQGPPVGSAMWHAPASHAPSPLRYLLPDLLLPQDPGRCRALSSFEFVHDLLHRGLGGPNGHLVSAPRLCCAVGRRCSCDPALLPRLRHAWHLHFRSIVDRVPTWCTCPPSLSVRAVPDPHRRLRPAVSAAARQYGSAAGDVAGGASRALGAAWHCDNGHESCAPEQQGASSCEWEKPVVSDGWQRQRCITAAPCLHAMHACVRTEEAAAPHGDHHPKCKACYHPAAECRSTCTLRWRPSGGLELWPAARLPGMLLPSTRAPRSGTGGASAILTLIWGRSFLGLCIRISCLCNEGMAWPLPIDVVTLRRLLPAPPPQLHPPAPEPQPRSHRMTI